METLRTLFGNNRVRLSAGILIDMPIRTPRKIKVKDGNKTLKMYAEAAFWLVCTLSIILFIYLALYRPDILVLGV